MPDAPPETFQSVMRGQNGQISPDFLPDGQAARLINVAVRGGLAKSRPSIRRIAALPEDGRFQGAYVYRLNRTERVVVVLSGRVWVYTVSEDSWEHIHTFPTVDFDLAYFCQADKYMIVQNGIYDPIENWPLIFHENEVYDNLESRFIWTDAPDEEDPWRAIGDFGAQTATAPERDALRVPIGKAMAYVHGRLFVAVDRFWEDGVATGEEPHWVSNTGLRFWLAGDIFQADNPSGALVFSDTIYLSGKAESAPAELGFITAIAPFRNAQTGSGMGPLVFLSQEGASAFAPGATREEWGRAEMRQVLFNSGGSESPWSLTQVNADLLYHARDGFRSIRYTASTEAGSGSLSSVPLSPEVQPFTDLTLRIHCPYVTIAHADNYVFATAAGVELDDGSVAFRAVLPWDVAVLQAPGDSARAFAGAWTGQLYHALFKLRTNAQDSAGVIYRDDTGLYLGEFDEDQAVDVKQVSRAYTPRFAFQSLVDIKRIERAELSFSEITSPVKYRVGWRVDGDDVLHWTGYSELTSGTYPAVSGLLWVPFPRDKDTPCLNGVQVIAGYQFQFVVEWVGGACLNFAIFRASAIATATGRASVCGSRQLTPVAGVPQTESVDLDEVYDFMKGGS